MMVHCIYIEGSQVIIYKKYYIFSLMIDFVFKAAKSVNFDLLFLEIMFLIFKNTVIKLKFEYTFYQVRKP